MNRSLAKQMMHLERKYCRKNVSNITKNNNEAGLTPTLRKNTKKSGFQVMEIIFLYLNTKDLFIIQEWPE